MHASSITLVRKHYFVALISLVVLFGATVVIADIVSGNVSTNSSTHATYTLVTVDSPASVTVGDLLLANIAINGGSPANVTAPSGWTQIFRTDNDTDVSLISYYKVAGASEPTNYTWTIDTQTRAEGGITQYSGVDTSNPIDAFAGNFSRGKVATTSSITTSSANEEVVASFAFDAGTSTAGYFSTPVGMTEKYDVTFPTAGPSLAADDTVQVATGTVGSISSTIIGNKNRNWASQLIALRKLPPTPSILDTLPIALSSGNNSTNANSMHGFASSNSFTYTVPSGGTNKVMVAWCSFADAQWPSVSVTQNGVTVPMTRLSPSGSDNQASMGYGTLAAPATGTFSFSTAGSGHYTCVVVTVQNAAQTGIVDSTVWHAFAANTSDAATLATNSGNTLLIDMADCGP
jgi:hypothetical protein